MLSQVEAHKYVQPQHLYHALPTEQDDLSPNRTQEIIELNHKKVLHQAPESDNSN